MDIGLVSEWYPPSKYLFKPIYNFLRRKVGLNQYVSCMLTFDISAILHGAPFLALEKYMIAAISGGFFVGLGLLAAREKYIENRKRYKKNEFCKIEAVFKKKTIDSIYVSKPLDVSALEKSAKEERKLNDGGEQQNKEKESITLDQRQILELEQVILDRDKDAALKFLEDNIYKPIKRRRESHCKPPF